MSASTGGGIFFAGSLILNNTLVARNTGDQAGPDIALFSENSGSTVTLTGDNLIGNSAGSGLDSSPLIGTSENPIDPLLAPLGNYGGPTETMIPLPGSPAIDEVMNSSFITDQRGFARNLNGDDNGGAFPDIGAVEAPNWSNPGEDDYPSIWLTDVDGDGNVFGLEFILGTDFNVSDAGNPKNLALTFPNEGEDQIDFGVEPSSLMVSSWILERSNNLLDWTVIGQSSSTDTETSVSIIVDQQGEEPTAFYRLLSPVP